MNTPVVDFVIDAETLSTQPNAVMLSFCFIPFERGIEKTFQEYIDSAYYWKIAIRQQVENGRHIDDDVVEFWESQPEEVKEKEYYIKESDISPYLFVKEFMKVHDKSNISKDSVGFCRGQDFDFPLIKDFIREFKSPKKRVDFGQFPCAYYNQKDIRSFISGLFADYSARKIDLPEDLIPGFEKHNAIHDCARAIIEIQSGVKWARAED